MYVLERLRVWISQGFYRWALSEIDPQHPDLPWLLLRQRELSDEAKRLFVFRASHR